MHKIKELIKNYSKNLYVKFHPNKKVLFSGSLVLLLGLVIGFLSGGGYVRTVELDETNHFSDESRYRYLPQDASLDEALSLGHYSHCLIYVGVGLTFDKQNMEGHLFVKNKLKTYPAENTEIAIGTKILTPLSVLQGGEIGDPVKIEFQNELEVKSVILNKVGVKKCFKKTFGDNVLPFKEF